MTERVWHFGEDWVSTPLEDIRIDVHLNSGVITMPLTMLVDMFYPLIAKRMSEELSIDLRMANPPTIKLNSDAIANAIYPFIAAQIDDDLGDELAGTRP